MVAGFEALCRLVKRYMGGGVDWEPPVGITLGLAPGASP